jgi:HAE1 family hydrophobic/amphiphilic exporter-1
MVCIARLKPWDKRKRDVKAIVGELFAKAASIKGAKVIFFAPPTIQGFGTGGGFEFQLQDKTGGDIKKFNEVGNAFLGALSKRPEFNMPQPLLTLISLNIKLM